MSNPRHEVASRRASKKPKRKPKGLVVTTRECRYGIECVMHVISATRARSIEVWPEWQRALRRAGWRPSKKPRKWVFTCEPAEE